MQNQDEKTSSSHPSGSAGARQMQDKLAAFFENGDGHQKQDSLASLSESDSTEQIDFSTAAGNCLKPLLKSLKWNGEERHLQEALPHFDKLHNIDGLRAILARLQYKSTIKQGALSALTNSDFPCLFQTKNNNLYVIISRNEEGHLLIYDGEEKFTRTLKQCDQTGKICSIEPMDLKAQEKNILRHGWMPSLLIQFRKTFFHLFILTFVINTFALMLPIYMMTVYDKAIGTKSFMTLGYLFAGIAIILALDMVLRVLRSRYISYLGTRVESLISINAFQRLLHLPVNMTASSPIGSQITRLKQFEAMRQIFNGPLVTSILDLPFLIVFLAAIFMIGGNLGWIPFGLIGLYAIMACISIPLTRLHVLRAGAAKSESRNFLMEMTSKHHAVRDNNADDIWINRYQSISKALLTQQFKAQQLNTIIQTMAQSFVMLAGTLTVLVGTLQVLEGELSMGALIAVIALIWKVLSPVQATFLSLSRVNEVAESFNQINKLMSLRQEWNPGDLPTFIRKFKGQLQIQSISHRYTALTDPSLRGLSLNIAQGEMIAVTGPSGSGKSTLLKMISRVYQPQAGVILLDGLDCRQIDASELRHAMGSVPQRLSFFYGTIAQNLKLAHPTATRDEMIKALKMAGAWDHVEKLERGLESRLQGGEKERYPKGFLQKIMLARAFIKDPAIYLLDEANNNLDSEGDNQLMETLSQLRGKATIVMVTHRPSHMYLADRVVVLKEGQVVEDASPEEVVPALLGQQKKKA